MISTSHARRFCIVLGAAIVLFLAASATSSDVRRSCSTDRDAHDGANVVDRAENVVDCAENHTASRTFFGAGTLDPR